MSCIEIQFKKFPKEIILKKKIRAIWSKKNQSLTQP